MAGIIHKDSAEYNAHLAGVKADNAESADESAEKSKVKIPKKPGEKDDGK